MRRDPHRAAWTAYVEQVEAPKPNKYYSERQGKYASRHEEEVAGKLTALARMGKIHDLKEQVRIELVAGKGKLRPVVYVADFTYHDSEGLHVLDAKGFKTQVYRLKKRLAALLLGIEIEEC